MCAIDDGAGVSAIDFACVDYFITWYFDTG